MSFGALDFVSLLGIPMLLGAGLLRAAGLDAGSDRLRWIALAWISGSTALGLLLLGLVWAELPVRPWLVGALLGGAGLALLLLVRRRDDPAPRLPTASLRARVAFGVAVGLSLLITADEIVLARDLPALLGDESWNWRLRAVALHEARGLNEAFGRLHGQGSSIAQPDYPLLNPLLQLYTFAHAGGLLFSDCRLPLQVFNLALVLLVASAARARAGPLVAAALVLVVAGSSEARASASRGEADHLMALGFLALLDSVDRFVRAGDHRELRVAAIAATLLLFSKNEGRLLVLCGMAPLVASALGRRSRLLLASVPLSTWVWLVPLLLPIAAQAAVNSRFRFVNEHLGLRDGTSMLERLVAQASGRTLRVLEEFAHRLFATPELTGVLFVLVVLLALLYPRRLALRRGALFLPAIALVLAGFAFIFVVSPRPLWNNIAFGTSRLVFQVVPATALALAAFLGELASGAGADRGAGPLRRSANGPGAGLR